MYGYVLQDWITIRGAGTVVTSIAQSESAWLGLAPFSDIALWLEVREITLSGLTAINMNYETAPIKDESAFTAMVTNGGNLSLSTVTAFGKPAITPILLAQFAAASNVPLCPVGRWVRWRLSTTGSATASWDLTFRVLACANAVSIS